MTTYISHRAAATIASSLPLVEPKRRELEAAIDRYMIRHGPWEPSADRRREVVSAIFDMLLDQAHRLGAAGEIEGDDRHRRRYRELRIDRAHHACVGDALAPVMRDTLGTDATSALLACWSDFYWAATLATEDGAERLAA